MDNNWKLEAIRVVRQRVYFFNSEGIYTAIPISEAREMKLKGLKMDKIQRQYCCADRVGAEARAIACLKEGDTVEKLEKDISRFTENLSKEKIRLTNTVYKIKGGKFYFFNDEGVYTCLEAEEIFPTNVQIREMSISRGKCVEYHSYSASYLEELIQVHDFHAFRNAFAKLKVGETVETLKKRCQKSGVPQKTRKQEELERVITKIQNPKFVCNSENTNLNNGFDYMYVDVNMISEWKTDRDMYIKKNIKEIDKLVLNGLKDNKFFLKHQISTDSLKVLKVVLERKTNVLYYVFEIKKN